MSLSGRDIICLSTHYWDERRFRKQEFMSRFARNNRVLYVEPSFSMARQPEGHLREVARNRMLKPRLEQRDHALYLLQPPRLPPKPGHPFVERVTYRWFAEVVRRAALTLELRDPVLWVYRPSFGATVDRIPHRHLVFDLVDDLAAYNGVDPVTTDRAIRSLVAKSDLLVVTAKTLEARYGTDAGTTVLVPNGFDSAIFSPAQPLPQPEALARLPRPLLGFVGTLFAFLDYELLERVARTHRDKTMVLVGPVERNVEDRLRRLTRLPNVVHIGRQPQHSIPSFIAAFDVCLNPFSRSAVADSVSPLKVYEYLAMGRPVVSTPMRALALEDVSRFVTFADGAEEFIKAIDVGLTSDGQSAASARRVAAAGHSWDRLFEQLNAVCERVLIRPVSHSS